MIDLSIVIVNWNVCDLLRDCLTSIVEAGDLRIAGVTDDASVTYSAEIIVVDAGSSDNSVAMLEREFAWVKLIDPNSNVGFSKGNNLGIEAAQGRHVLLLNPDTRIIGQALSHLLAYLDANPRVGVVGPKLLNSDGSTQSSRRRFPTLVTAIFESTWLEDIAPRQVLDHYYVNDRPDDEITDLDWVTGAAFVVRREVIDQVGMFDEGYFMYSEEMDWQRRIKSAGWQVVYLPEAKIIHYGGKSSEQVVPLRHIRFQNSKIRYFRKHHGVLTAAILRLVLLANYGWQLFLEWAKGIIGHKRELRRERVKAYWQVLRSGLRGA